MDTFLGLTFNQWAILFGWDKNARPTYQEAIALKYRYLSAFKMLPSEQNEFGIEPDMDFEKATLLFEDLIGKVFR